MAWNLDFIASLELHIQLAFSDFLACRRIEQLEMINAHLVKSAAVKRSDFLGHTDCLPQNGVTVMLKLLKKLRHWFRSSITGKFVSEAYAKANPRTTVEEKDRG